MKQQTDTASDGATCYALFIGGIADGERHKDNGDTWRRIQRAVCEPQNFYREHPLEHRMRIESTIYRRELIRGEKERLAVFVAEGMNMDEVFLRLLRFYSPHNETAQTRERKESQ